MPPSHGEYAPNDIENDLNPKKRANGLSVSRTPCEDYLRTIITYLLSCYLSV